MSAADKAQTIQTLALNVRLSCQLLVVPESSYYERINRHPSKTQLRRQYPYHNASLESWHGHLKREWVYQFKYKNFEEAYQSIFWYIEAFYNSKRIHQSLGYLTPNQFEKVSA